MQNNNFLLDIVKDNKLVKQIAHEIKNSKGSPTEIISRIAHDYNFELPKGVNFEIHLASDDVYFFIIPAALMDTLEGIEDFIVAADSVRTIASTLGTAGSISTLSTASCGATTFTASSMFSVATMSSIAGYGHAPYVPPVRVMPGMPFTHIVFPGSGRHY